MTARMVCTCAQHGFGALLLMTAHTFMCLCAQHGFGALLLAKVLCEDKLVGAMRRYVVTSLGPTFIESPSTALSGVRRFRTLSALGLTQ